MVRPVRVAILACLLVLALFALRAVSSRSHGQALAPPGTDARAEQDRAQRQQAVAEIAPLPDAELIPLPGKPGTDADGFPTQHVDRAVVRGLLRVRRFGDLNRLFEQLEDAFDKDARYEAWPHDAAMAFDSAEPGIMSLLDAWVALAPSSFAPYLCRGVHRVAVGFAQRGGHYVADTHATDLRAMAETHAAALVDLEKARSLRPRVVAALYQEIRVLMAGGARAQLDQTAKTALAECPTCFLPRYAWMRALTPRWGGSYAEMQAVVDAAPLGRNPRLRALAGYPDLDRGELLEQEKHDVEARAAFDRALSHGEYWRWLDARANVEMRVKDDAGARRDLDRALSLAPSEPELLVDRAYALYHLEEFVLAANDLLAALRVDPTHHGARELVEPAVQGLVYTATHLDAAHHEEALRLLELACDLAPQDRAAQGWRIKLLTDGTTAADIERLRAQLVERPDDLRLHQRVDYLLSSQGRFADIVAMWDVYLAHHPDDGRAHLERGGAHYHLAGHRDAARADAARACELGIGEGCLRAKQFH